jgi:hypothetical protein
MVYEDFVSFMRCSVLPHQKEHPKDIRLDGELTGRNRKVFVYFRHNGHVWKVHEDTHYEPLMLALSAAQVGEDPFVESDTAKGKGRCLVLTGELAAHQQTGHKYLYIYSN